MSVRYSTATLKFRCFATATMSMGFESIRDPMLEELVLTEKYSAGGTAHAFSAVLEKYENDLAEEQRKLLLSVLIADKAGFEVRDRNDAHALFSCLSGTGVSEIEHAAADLAREFGVLEWNDRFGRYVIISDAVPRSAFNRFLDQKVKDSGFGRVGAQNGGEWFWAGSLQNERDSVFTYGI